MKTLLTDLDLSEVSLVDKGANGGAKIMLYKRDEPARRIVDVSKVKLQSAITRTRIALAKGGPGSGNFGHAGRPGQVGGSVAGDGGKPTSGDPLENSARDALDSYSEVQGRSKQLEDLYDRYGGNTRVGREAFRVKEAYDRAGEYYQSAARSYRKGNDLRAELLMDKAERWHDEADQLARLIGY